MRGNTAHVHHVHFCKGVSYIHFRGHHNTHVIAGIEQFLHP